MTQHYFGHRIQQLRKSKGWSHADLAKRLGKKASSISSYETDAKAIPVDTLILLAELWDVTIDELIYGENVEILSVKSLSPEEKQLVSELIQNFAAKSGSKASTKVENLELLLRIAQAMGLP